MNTTDTFKVYTDELLERALACCHSRAWAEQFTKRAPFSSKEDMLTAADQTWECTELSARLEACKGHPMIGDLKAAKAKWTSQEQAGSKVASDETLQGLADMNHAYLKKHGFIFIVCATGKSADEMLNILKDRYDNTTEVERQNCANALIEITKLRLVKLLDEFKAKL